MSPLAFIHSFSLYLPPLMFSFYVEPDKCDFKYFFYDAISPLETIVYDKKKAQRMEECMLI